MADLWVPDYAGQREFLMHSMELNAALRANATAAMNFAKRIAPVGSPADDDEHPGQYRDSIYAERIPTEEGPGWSFGAADEKSHWIEYGARHMRRYAVLHRAAAIFSGDEFAGFA